MRVSRQAISPMPELLSYWLPLEDAKVMNPLRQRSDCAMIEQAPDRFIGLAACPCRTSRPPSGK